MEPLRSSNNSVYLDINSSNPPPVALIDHRKLIGEWQNLSKIDFVKENCSKKSALKASAIAVFAFFSPGISMRFTGMLLPQATMWGEVTNITYASWSCWKNPFRLGDMGILMTQMGSGYWLYNELTNSVLPTSQKFSIWKIDRLKIFLNMHMIPEKYEDKSFFQENDLICPITNQPIRFPVYEETTKSQGNKGKKYYEQSAICAWLLNRETSPITRKKLTLDDITYDFEMADLIEQKLQEWEKE